MSSRSIESKVSELDERLESIQKQVKELKADKDEEIKEIFFQEIRFDPKLYKDGESKVNLLLKMENVHIFKQFQNDAGLVIELGRWKKRVMKNYRNHQQIVYDVLTITYESNRSGIKTTSLLTKANLSHSRLEKFVKKLTGAGLVNKIEVEGKKTFIITENGRTLLEEYNKFTRFAEGFGLEL